MSALKSLTRQTLAKSGAVQLVLGRGHSVLSDGCSVKFAGQLKFNRKGSLVEITNNSGHYRPPSGRGLTEKAKEYLEQLGIDVSGATVNEIGEG